MRQELDPNEPSHARSRDLLRIVGPALIGLGLLLMAVGTTSFFTSFGSFEPPRYFWCNFVGIPVLFVGIVLSKFAYMGAVTRYMANEVTPVGRDVTNFMVQGTKDSVRDLAAAIGAGLRGDVETDAEGAVHCAKCQVENDATAKFCKGCGTMLTQRRGCTACGTENDADARFCDHCGRSLV